MVIKDPVQAEIIPQQAFLFETKTFHQPNRSAVFRIDTGIHPIKAHICETILKGSFYRFNHIPLPLESWLEVVANLRPEVFFFPTVETTRPDQLIVCFSNNTPAVVAFSFRIFEEIDHLPGFIKAGKWGGVHQVSGESRVAEVAEDEFSVRGFELPQSKPFSFKVREVWWLFNGRIHKVSRYRFGRRIS